MPESLKKRFGPKGSHKNHNRCFHRVRKGEKGLLLKRLLIARLPSLHPVQILLILIFTKERRGGGLPLQRLHTGEKHLDHTTQQLSLQGGPATAGQQLGQIKVITSSSSSSSSLGGERDVSGPLIWNTGSSFSPSATVRLTQPDRNTLD